jgi:tRNA (adenine57-N1/adenine58-N1)-methyltransferase catalytic subunit
LMDEITPETFVLVYRDRRRRWIVRPKDVPRLHTHLGILDVSSLVGRSFGIRVSTSLGDELVILKPTIEDMIMKLSRSTQIVYPKDLGLMMVKLGVHSGSHVVETGTGTGATTALLAYLVQPEGMVHTFDRNPAFQEVAKKNIERVGLASYVEFNLADSSDGFGIDGMDAGVLDVGDPWEVVDSMSRSLKPAAPMAAVTPTTNQAERLVQKMNDTGFVAIETLEIMMRHLEARVGKTRPSGMMIGHTAYLTFGRNTISEKVAQASEESEQAARGSEAA